MEPYSADKIKRKKRKYQEPNPTGKIITPIPFKLAFRKVNVIDIYNGEEKMAFKKRVLDYQTILRDEFE